MDCTKAALDHAITLERYQEMINRGECLDPVAFLASVSGGIDPRKISKLYDLVLDIEEFGGGDISADDWKEVATLIKEQYKFKTVSLSESITAAKTLAEYIHPKRKQIETSDIKSTLSVKDHPLTKEEAQLLKEVFNDEY